MAPQSRLCLICGATFSGDVERRQHIEAEHPGQRVAWHAKRPYVVAPDGVETIIGAASLKRMRANARKAAGKAPRGPGGRFAAPVSLRKDTPALPALPPAVERPLPDDPDAPPWFVQSQPAHFATGGVAVGPAPTDEAGEPVAPSVAPPVSRETLRAELGQPMLAEILRNLSVVMSEWDGAGSAGHFSQIEAAQLAMLLHEPTLDAVDRWFGGNVNRFRLGMAAVVILLGKGRIHARAIAARRAERAVLDEDGLLDRQAAESAPALAREVDPEPVTLDPIAQLAARQQAARNAMGAA